MKHFLLFLSAAIFYTGCSSNSSSGSSDKKDTVVIRDTVTMNNGHSRERGLSHRNNASSQDQDVNGAYSTSSSNPANAPAVQQEAPVKKGWSSAAKDAAIGGGGGAVAGALLDSKNRLVGGALGGLIGAGAGYLIGRARDRKTGRVVKHSAVSNP